MSTRKILTLLVVVALLICLVFGFWIHSSIESRWSAMDKRVGELISEARSRDARRPILEGTSIPGNAWDDYAGAVTNCRKVLTSVPRGMAIVAELRNRIPQAMNSPSDRVKASALLDSLHSDFDRLRKGSHRSECQFPYDWDHLDLVIPLDSPVGSHAEWLANAAALEARRLVETGHMRDAVELLLATAQFGRDLRHNGLVISELIGRAICWIALDEMRDMILSGKLDHEGLLGVDRGLEVLDRNFTQSGSSLRNQALAIGKMFLRGELFKAKQVFADPDPVTIQASWRQAYSAKLLQADAFFRLEDWSRRLADVGQRSYAEERRVLDEITAESASNRLAMFFNGAPGNLSAARRSCLAQLRLVRAAARYRATGEVLQLDDPFASTLQHSLIGGRLKVWSVGKDRVDDRGVGGWGQSNQGKDIVLEVER
jgi:hypothetical protein